MPPPSHTFTILFMIRITVCDQTKTKVLIVCCQCQDVSLLSMSTSLTKTSERGDSQMELIAPFALNDSYSSSYNHLSFDHAGQPAR